MKKGQPQTITYHWPAHVERAPGRVRIVLMHMPDCATEGATVIEAVRMARRRAEQIITERALAGEMIIPPLTELELDALVSGRMIRIALEVKL